jgi:hypothetical protein
VLGVTLIYSPSKGTAMFIFFRVICHHIYLLLFFYTMFPSSVKILQHLSTSDWEIRTDIRYDFYICSKDTRVFVLFSMT